MSIKTKLCSQLTERNLLLFHLQPEDGANIAPTFGSGGRDGGGGTDVGDNMSYFQPRREQKEKKKKTPSTLKVARAFSQGRPPPPTGPPHPPSWRGLPIRLDLAEAVKKTSPPLDGGIYVGSG